MQDQVDSLKDNGIRGPPPPAATCLNSSIDHNTLRQREAALLNGDIKLLYVSPERVLSPGCLQLLEQLSQRVGILAASPLMRPTAFQSGATTLGPNIGSCLPCDRTSPPGGDDGPDRNSHRAGAPGYLQQLRLRDPLVHVAALTARTCFTKCAPRVGRPTWILRQQVRDHSGSGIIYCLSRRQVDELATRLAQGW